MQQTKTFVFKQGIIKISYIEFPLVPDQLVKRWNLLPSFTMLANGEVDDLLNEPVPIATEMVGYSVSVKDGHLNDYLANRTKIVEWHRKKFWLEQSKKQITFNRALDLHHAW